MDEQVALKQYQLDMPLNKETKIETVKNNFLLLV